MSNRRRRAARGVAFVLCCVLSLGGLRPAGAVEDKELARSHFATGMLLYDHGRFDEALTQFESAQSVT